MTVGSNSDLDSYYCMCEMFPMKIKMMFRACLLCLTLPFRIRSHGPPVRWRKGLLHRVLCDWYPLHPPLPHRCRAKDHGLQHAEADLLHPLAVGPVEGSGGRGPRRGAQLSGPLLLPPHPSCCLLGAGGQLELPGFLLLLLHLAQHNRSRRLRPRRGSESEVQGAV